MSQPVITVDAALHALASANTPGELITLSNQAAALQVYARRAKLGMLAQNRCAEIRLRAERKLGELLTTTPRLHGRPKSVPDENTFPSLSELGVAIARSPTGRSASRPCQSRISRRISGIPSTKGGKSRRGTCSCCPSDGRRHQETASGSLVAGWLI